MEQSTITGPSEQKTNGTTSRDIARKGPPNRMNDLSYTSWMKFQKSFFMYTGRSDIAKTWIEFFTKATWPDTGRPSSTLLLGTAFAGFRIDPPRLLDAPPIITLRDVSRALFERANRGAKYDFVLIDMAGCFRHARELDEFLDVEGREFFSLLRQVLAPGKYGTILIEGFLKSDSGFPIAWSISEALRDNLKLRDEKIALIGDSEGGDILYCVHFQADRDLRPGRRINSGSLRLSRAEVPKGRIPAWIIPKPPPRKPNELLHPAKFPETLIEEFIELFSAPGDTVFDPMVGTGSAVLAAINKGRVGVGVELSPEYSHIACERILRHLTSVERRQTSLPLLCEQPGTDTQYNPQWRIVTGDATRLDEIAELSTLSADYVVTSPPYWSILTNKGSENQRNRRRKNLPLVYSDDPRDLGNIQSYEEFLEKLDYVYNSAVASKLRAGGYLTIIVKNVKRSHVVYPLAWDLVLRLAGPGGKYEFIGNTFWCQDDVSMKPFAVGTHWVSNVVHHYCLHFRKLEACTRVPC